MWSLTSPHAKRISSSEISSVTQKRLFQHYLPNPDVGASGGMAGSVAVDRQLPQRVVGGCGAEFIGEVLVDGSHQALAGAGCSFSARLVLLTCSPDYHRSNKKGPGLGVSGPGSCD